GASRTMLFASYFRKYKQWVLANAVKTTTEYGGAGGIRKKQVLTLPTLPLYLNNRKVLLRKIDVLQEEVFAGETFYGNIGQDFITQFDELVMNFLNMSIQAW
ncbi:MAG TPA: hypothetical protein VL307_06070, partial [Chitinophagaceae bacterium]|nr:hypothetical protein [Chitinophagaceae bacterium]